ncbi:MAG: ABC transporter ATP-binding protein, partial [Pseudomonadota bacterium]
AIINHGEVVACDDTPVLLSRLDAKTLLLRLKQPLDIVPEIPGTQSSLREPDLLALTYSRSAVSAPQLIVKAEEIGLEIADITTEEPNLEEVFLALTSDRAA